MQGIKIDGNNILEVYHTINDLAADLREKPRPVLVECITFRMRGHEEASGTKYVPKELFEEWQKKDPLINFETWLLQKNILHTDEIDELKKTFKEHISLEIEKAFNEPEPVADYQTEINDMYAPNSFEEQEVDALIDEKKTIRFLDAIKEAMQQAMRKHQNLVIMGQDIAEYGGAFKVTAGFVEEFGKGRVRNTPICESAIVGMALGLSINGFKAIMEMQFADFVTCGFNQIINNLAKTHYRWGEKADIVIRMPTGAGTGAGPFHSQSNEAWFTKTPGLKVVYPAFADDAKGLLIAAIEDPNPVIYFEHKYLYRKISSAVPNGYFSIPIGKAKVIVEGEDLSIITYGLGVHWVLDYLQSNKAVSIDLVDLRSLQPWDIEAVEKSVKKTGRVIILHEDTLTNGFGAEIAAYIAEHCFSFLDAPVLRCASLDTAVPMNKILEKEFLANARLADTIKKIMTY